MRNRTARIFATVALILLIVTAAGAAGSRPATPPQEPDAVPDAEKAGHDAYNAGLKLRDKAWEHEEKAAGSSSDAKRPRNISPTPASNTSVLPQKFVGKSAPDFRGFRSRSWPR